MSSPYKTTIGLEIHAELLTKSKLFCYCKNNPEEEVPNKNICEICMGYPGAMPKINKEAIKSILKLGLALGSELAEFSEFDRKHYFYPDIPKGYQITQYKYPLIRSGELLGKKITRAHLEEDTARSQHTVTGSVVDFNRAGIPLIELVTDPVFTNEEEASQFAEELQLILRHLGISKARMQLGEMRVEANVSISKDDKLGTKVELKNINSFKVVREAIKYEIKRQEEVLEKQEKVAQETRGWNENKNITFSQRQKETSGEYRYYPEPDLSKFNVKHFDLDAIKSEIPNLPSALRQTYKDVGLTDLISNTIIHNLEATNIFNEVLEKSKANAKLIANYLANDVMSFQEEFGGKLFDNLNSDKLIQMAEKINKGKLSSRGAKDLIRFILIEGGEVEELIKKHDLEQEQDESVLLEIVEKVIECNPSVVEEYRQGKEKSIQFLVGQVMQESKGRANPSSVLDLLKKSL